MFIKLCKLFKIAYLHLLKNGMDELDGIVISVPIDT